MSVKYKAWTTPASTICFKFGQFRANTIGCGFFQMWSIGYLILTAKLCTLILVMKLVIICWYPAIWGHACVNVFLFGKYIVQITIGVWILFKFFVFKVKNIYQLTTNKCNGSCSQIRWSKCFRAMSGFVFTFFGFYFGLMKMKSWTCF